MQIIGSGATTGHRNLGRERLARLAAWRPGPARLVLAALSGLAWLILASGSDASAAASNRGGVLLLHAEGTGDVVAGSDRPCNEASLLSWDQAVTRIPGNAVPRLVMVYAAFPPESTAVLAAETFGILYSPNVRVHAFGACNGDGIEIPGSEWPASGGGVAIANRPFREGSLVSIYWFSISCSGPGWFELVPNPAPRMAGRFANDAQVPQSTAISAYGRLGFDMDGALPEPGHPALEGACCVDVCRKLSDVECAYYDGDFLGEGSDCENDPCGAYPIRGACCLPDGRCEMLSRRDCARQAGSYQGDGLECTPERPCPEPAPAGGEGTGDAGGGTGGAGSNGGGPGAPATAPATDEEEPPR